VKPGYLMKAFSQKLAKTTPSFGKVSRRLNGFVKSAPRNSDCSGRKIDDNTCASCKNALHHEDPKCLAPTLTSEKGSKDRFYEALRDTLHSIPRSDKIVLLGDFNARVNAMELGGRVVRVLDSGQLHQSERSWVRFLDGPLKNCQASRQSRGHVSSGWTRKNTID